MGISDLLSNLPGGPIGQQKTRFAKCKEQLAGRKLDIDSGSLLFVCAIAHKETYSNQIYEPAVAEFLGLLITLRTSYRWDFTVIFDGQPPKEKAPEHERRKKRDDGIVITSLFIGMCVNVCRRYYINYVVAPCEADVQVGRRHSAIAVTRDSDLIAYGNEQVLIVDSYKGQKWRFIDMTIPLSDDLKEKFPLFAYYKRWGLRIIHWWAAVMGCDISIGDTKCGIKGVGPVVFFKALESFRTNNNAPDSESFANSLLQYSSDAVKVMHTSINIRDELDRVSKWFSCDGQYYDDHSNLVSIAGAVLRERNKDMTQHMLGEVNPKNKAPWTTKEQNAIEKIHAHNLVHNSSADRTKIPQHSLPEGVEDIHGCRVNQLKNIVISHGGTCTGEGRSYNKQELMRYSAAHLLIEQENPIFTQVFNRTQDNNGTFVTIDTSERKSVPQILDQLIRTGDCEKSLTKFFEDVMAYLHEEKFTDDFETIVQTAPELEEHFIYDAFAHVGDSQSQKSIARGLQSCMQYNSLLYHAMAFADDKKSIYLVGKQRASQNRDDKSSKPTEKDNFQEYLTMVQISIQPTTMNSHGHELGVCNHVLRKFCVRCKAGCGMCYHISALLNVQRHHWGPNRPTAKPSTTDLCGWYPGATWQNRTANLTEPASRIQRQKLPTSEAEAKQRLEKGARRNCNLGVPALYKIHRDKQKMKVFDSAEYKDPKRFAKLFQCLRDANKGRPCKAEIRWHGALESGLVDVRADIVLWGTASEIERWHELRDLETNKELSNTEISELVLAEDWPTKLKRIHIEQLDKIHKK